MTDEFYTFCLKKKKSLLKWTNWCNHQILNHPWLKWEDTTTLICFPMMKKMDDYLDAVAVST